MLMHLIRQSPKKYSDYIYTQSNHMTRHVFSYQFEKPHLQQVIRTRKFFLSICFTSLLAGSPTLPASC